MTNTTATTTKQYTSLDNKECWSVTDGTTNLLITPRGRYGDMWAVWKSDQLRDLTIVGSPQAGIAFAEGWLAHHG